MKKIVTIAAIGAFAFAAASPVFAIDASNPTAPKPAQQVEQKPAASPAISSEQTGAIDRAMLVPGANSFTESQAKQRIEDAGFTHVGTLTMDDQGIWRGSAAKGAMTVNVGLDFKGNVAADSKSMQ